MGDRLAHDIPPSLAERGAGYAYRATDFETVNAAVRQVTRPTVASLLVFGGVTGAATIAVAGLAIWRVLRRNDAQQRTLSAVGATHGQRMRFSASPALIAVLVGTGVAIPIAVVGSVVGPVGSVRAVDPSPGYSLPGAVLPVVGAIALVLVLITWVLALSGARRSTVADERRRRPSWVTGRLARSGRPSVTQGVGAALGAHGSDGGGVVLAGSVVVIAAIVAARGVRNEPRHPRCRVVVLALSTVLNSALALALEHATAPDDPPADTGSGGERRHRRAGVFGYHDLIVVSLNRVLRLGGPRVDHAAPVHLPIGVSFVTFEAVSFVVDVYDGTRPPRAIPCMSRSIFRSFRISSRVRSCAFADIAASLARPWRTLTGFDRGISRFVIGLGRKYSSPIRWASSSTRSSRSGVGTTRLPPWLGIVCYTLQIYFDFSGYSDVAIGLRPHVRLTLPDFSV